jgi:anti-sigma regulatory factor (Ser/Thr protein kinase)
MTVSRRIPVTESSQAGHARRCAAELAITAGFDDTQAGRLGIIVAEAAKNLFKHARDGEILLRTLAEEPSPGIEVLSIDRGPGMEDISRCMEDGYSTAGSPGTGLGAISRLASAFEIYSLPGQGTVLMARVSAAAQEKKPASLLQVGAVTVAVPGEEHCGDGWALNGNGASRVMITDGLGHGRQAWQATTTALRVFLESSSAEPAQMLRLADGALRSTRGAAVAVVQFDRERNELVFAGAGNIAGRALTGDTERNFISHNGIVGQEIRRIQEFVYPWQENALVVLHSDGLQTRWSLDAYPGLRTRHASLIAAVLYRDFRRPKDDITVLAIRRAPA